MTTPRLQEKYQTEIAERMRQNFGIKNKMATPKITKVVLSMGVGKALENKNRITAAAKELSSIAGQKAVVRNARRSVSAFKLREGNPIGVMVTLRGQRMYEFLDRLISIAVPRIRDFRGLNPKGFDGRGNYNMGLTEQSVFPEINLDKVEFIQGMNIAIVTTARTDEQAQSLLTELGMPFRK